MITNFIFSTCFSVSNLWVYVTRVFHRKTFTVSSFHWTHLSSFFFTHIYVESLLKFWLRYRLKMSDCNIGNFNFEPLLTLHGRIQTLLRVGIMLQSSSKKIRRVSLDTRKGVQFEFVLICFNSFKWKCFLGLSLKSFTRISSKF